MFILFSEINLIKAWGNPNITIPLKTAIKFIDVDMMPYWVGFKSLPIMIQNKNAFLKFNGKAILGKFYQKHIQEKGIKMGFDVFCYSIAERMGKNDRTPKSIEETLNSIKDSLASIVPNQPTSQ